MGVPEPPTPFDDGGTVEPFTGGGKALYIPLKEDGRGSPRAGEGENRGVIFRDAGEITPAGGACAREGRPCRNN